MSKLPEKSLRMEKLFAWVIVVGMMIVGTVGVQRRVYSRSLSLPGQVQAYYQQEEISNDSQGVPVRMQVEDKVDVPVEATTVGGGDLWISEVGATYLMDTARLGQNGNVIVYGHNTADLLDGLRDVRAGDEIVMKANNGSMYRYQVEIAQAVDPAETSWLEQSDEAVLTAYTCTGFLDSQRWVVRAKLVTGSS